jgi:sulfite reductase (NADPH) hemoprotein beta-component
MIEAIKARSNFLRGTLAESLTTSFTAALAEDDTQISKFHGIYQQDDRDLRAERMEQKLEPAYNFMVRVCVPGGVATPVQWLELDELANTYGNGTLRLTTRQAFQLHGVLKENLKKTIQGVNAGLLNTLAACGDVSRNVMCTPLAEQSAVHRATCEWAKRVSKLLTPKTRAYREIWLDGEKLVDTKDEEPIYGPAYLPRKFKTSFVIPPSNDVDVFAHDLGFIAVQRGGELAGFNVTVGGGMALTHGDPKTYPRLADVLGLCSPEQVLDVAEQVVKVQRDHGDRRERKHARLKYAIDDRGLAWFKQELEQRLGFPLLPPAPFAFTHRGDPFGWIDTDDGRVHLVLFVPSGRIKDSGEHRFLSGLRAIARLHTGDFRLTANQNLIIGNITPNQKPQIEALVREHGLDLYRKLKPLKLNALACVALPSCGLAMAEAERYLPELLEKVKLLLETHGLEDADISLRMTGCPNGCTRPYLAEIGLVGKAPGRYNLFIGGGGNGQRLNALHRENIGETEILQLLDTFFAAYAKDRLPDEPFGDFLRRTAQT